MLAVLSARNDVVHEPIEYIGERVLSSALGADVSLEIAAVSGNWYDELAVEGVSLHLDGGALRSVAVDRVSIRHSWGTIDSVLVRGGRLEVLAGGDRRVPADPGGERRRFADVVAGLPGHISLDTEVSVTLRRPSGEVVVRARAAISGTLADGLLYSLVYDGPGSDMRLREPALWNGPVWTRGEIRRDGTGLAFHSRIGPPSPVHDRGRAYVNGAVYSDPSNGSVGRVELAVSLGKLDAWARGRVEQSRYTVEHGTLRLGDGVRLSLAGTADFDRAMAENLSISAQIADLALLSVVFPEAPPLAGRAEVRGSGSVSWGGDAALSVLESLDGSVAGRAHGLEIGQSRFPRVSAAGSVKNGTLTLESALLVTEGEVRERFALTEPTTVVFAGPPYVLAPTRIESRYGSVVASGRFSDGSGQATLIADSIPIDVVAARVGLSAPTTGRASAELRVSGNVDSPRASLQVESSRWLIDGTEAYLRLAAVQDERSVVIETIQGRWGQDASLSGSGRLPVRFGEAGMRLLSLQDASLDITARHREPGRLLPDDVAQLAPTRDGRLSITLAERSGDLRVNLRALMRGPDTEDDFSRVSVAGRFLEQGGDRITSTGEIALENATPARWEAEITVPGLSTGDPAIRAEEIVVDAKTEVDLPLDLIARSFPEFVVFAGGRLVGEISARGPVSTVEPTGRFRIENGELRAAAELPPVTAVFAEVLLTTREVTVVELRGELGRAPFRAAGSVGIPGPAGEARISLDLTGENLLLYSDDAIRVRGDTRLQIGRTISAPTVSGEIEIREARYVRDVPLISLDSQPSIEREELLLFSVPGPRAGATELDIAITSEETLVVDNNVAQIRASADVTLGGTLRVPVVTGRVFARSGVITLPVNELQLQSVTVEFPRNQPFEPTLAAQGSSLIRGYDVQIQVSGTVDAPEIQVSSVPALPRDQALLLLATGFVDYGDLELGGRTARTIGVYLGRRLFELLQAQANVESGIAERVEVVVGRRLSQSGSEVIEVEFRLSEEERWFLEFERDRFDDYNVGLAWRVWFD